MPLLRERALAAEPEHLASLERENQKLRLINKVLMDRVEGPAEGGVGNGFALFQQAVTLDNTVSERTAALTALTRQLMHEISERREAESALTEAKAAAEQANLGKTKFLAAASHDLHQPLDAARLFLGALAEEIETPRGRGLVERIEAALDTIDDLLSALLDISKLDAGYWLVDRTSFTLHPLLRRLGQEFEPQAQALGLRMRVMPTTLVVHTDRRLLERLLRNLIGNALRYTERGQVLVGCRRRGEQVRIDVIDTGIGIPRDKWRDIFEEFNQLAPTPQRADKGLGLGLAIVDRIARLLDLTLDLDSRVGRGSRFSLLLPRGVDADLPDDAAASASSEPGASPHGRAVLVIDDDVHVVETLAGLLRAWGMVVAAATSTPEALDRLGEMARPPDLVIADYQLRGETGVATIAEVRRRAGRLIPAVVMSSDRSPELRAALKAQGLPFLAKPFVPARVRATVGFMLARQPPPSRSGGINGR